MESSSKVTAAMKSVRVKAIPLLPEVGNHAAGSMDVMVRVAAAGTSGVPIDLVAVLDVASSMDERATPSADKPTRLDMLKRAMRIVAKQLRDCDSISLVTFNDKVDSTRPLWTISASNREEVNKTVDELKVKPAQCTALKPGLEEAVKILNGRSNNNKDRQGVIFLLSDGIDTSQQYWGERMSAADRALLKHYPVHTFGLGASHDPKALFFITHESGGTYSFVRDNLGDVTQALGLCLAGLKSIVSVDTRVEIKAASGAQVEIAGIKCGGCFQVTISNTKKSAELVGGTLYDGEVKRFKVTINYKSFKDATTQKLLTITVGKYKPSPGGTAEFIAMDEDELSIRRTSGEPAAVAPPEAMKLRAWLDALDVVTKFREEQNQVLDKIGTMKSDKKMDSDTLSACHGAAQALSRKWQDCWRHNWEAWMPKQKEVPPIKSLGWCVGELDREIHAMTVDLHRGHGAAYLYSWLSSYNMQRASIMGSPDKVVTLFLTTKMEAEQKVASKQQPLLPAEQVSPAKAASATKPKQKESPPTTSSSPDKQKEASIKQQRLAEAAAAKEEEEGVAAGGGVQAGPKVRGLQPARTTPPATTLPAGQERLVLDQGAIRRRLAYWDGIRKLAPRLLPEHIDRAMHKDIYEIVERAMEDQSREAARHASSPTTPATENGK